MEAPTKITLLYEECGSKSFAPFTLLQVLALQNNNTAGCQPLAIIVEGMDKMLYYNITAVQAFVNNEILFEEFYEANWCDGLYRNERHIKHSSGRVEAGSLWMLRDDEMLLINDDEFITCNFNELSHLFRKI